MKKKLFQKNNWKLFLWFELKENICCFEQTKAERWKQRTTFFYRKTNEFIYRSNDLIIDDHVYEFRRFCIFHLIIQDIFVVAHNDNHFEFVRCYDKISFNYYIRDFIKYLRDFFKHCSKCQTYQTRRHMSYDSF